MFDQFAPNSYLLCCVPFMRLPELQSLFCKPSALQFVVCGQNWKAGNQETSKKGITNYFNVRENVISVDTFFQRCLSIGKREFSVIEVKKSNIAISKDENTNSEKSSIHLCWCFPRPPPKQPDYFSNKKPAASCLFSQGKQSRTH